MSDDESPADIALEQAERVVDAQQAALSDINTKAIKLLRLDVVLIGAVVSVVSIVARTDVATEAISSGYTITGGLLLLGSTVTAALTYTTSQNKAGPSGTDIARMVSGDFDSQQVRIGLARSYATWIQENYETNVWNVPFLTASIVSLVSAFVFFAFGLVDSVVGGLPRTTFVAPVLLTILLAVQTNLYGQVVRVRNSSKSGQTVPAGAEKRPESDDTSEAGRDERSEAEDQE